MLEDVVDQRVLELNSKLKLKFADSTARFDWAEWNRYGFRNFLSSLCEYWCLLLTNYRSAASEPARQMSEPLLNWVTDEKIDRYFMYDVISQFIYGKPVGFLKESSDVEGLIKAWQSLFNIGGMMASMPWLIRPILFNLFSKRLVLPNTVHGKELNKIHRVREHGLNRFSSRMPLTRVLVS